MAIAYDISRKQESVLSNPASWLEVCVDNWEASKMKCNPLCLPWWRTFKFMHGLVLKTILSTVDIRSLEAAPYSVIILNPKYSALIIWATEHYTPLIATKLILLMLAHCFDSDWREPSPKSYVVCDEPEHLSIGPKVTYNKPINASGRR
jgi:hypothetical protein